MKLKQPKQNYVLELRLYPNVKQRIFFAKSFGCCRFIFNNALSETTKHYEETKEFCFYNDLSKYLLQLKHSEEYKWLKEVDSTCLQQSLKHLDNGLTNYIKFKQGKRKGNFVGFPKYKSRKNKQSFKMMCVNNNIKLNLDESYIKLPKIGKIKLVVDKRRPEGKISSVTIKKNKSGKYFVSVLFEQEKEFTPYIANQNKAIGLDFGLKTFITTSEGEKIESPQYFKKSLKRIQKLARRHSKKKTNSKNREKARIKLAKAYEKETNQRKDFNHKLSRKFVNKYDFIFIEDLNIAGMKKRVGKKEGCKRGKKRFGKKISDIAWSQLVSFMSYKAILENKYVLKIDKWFPSTQLCSECGYQNKELTMNDRTWSCPQCGVEHDRDINAAINILNEGKRFYYSPDISLKEIFKSTDGSSGS